MRQGWEYPAKGLVPDDGFLVTTESSGGQCLGRQVPHSAKF